jgi:hypothetical protein
MNIPNSCAFVGTGIFMELLSITPGITVVRELWLIVMGGVMLLTGGGFLAQMGWEWVKPRMFTPMLALLPRPAEARSREIPEGRRASV